MPTSNRVAAARRLQTRAAAIQPKTYDEETRSALALLATEDPVYSTDAATGKPVLEVWRMDGLEEVDQVPLCDAHDRESVADVLGSVSDIAVRGRELYGRVRISEAEGVTATKVREGHIRDVSAGIQPLDVVVIRAGDTQDIAGRTYTAPEESDLRIVLRWQLREVSLCPIGADPRAKIRSLTTEVRQMNDELRAYLRSIGMDENATEEQEREFYDSLPEGARKRADEAAADHKEPDGDEVRSEGEPDGDEVRSEGEEENKEGEGQRSSRAPVVTRAARKPKRTADQIAATERSRISEIHRLGAGVSAELVRKAVDEGWSKEKAAVAFLEAGKARSAAALPAIHTRSHEDDCTAETLGMGLAIRAVGDNKLFGMSAQYVRTEGGDYVLRRTPDVEKHKRKMGELLERSYGYSHMSLADVCREACRLDGKQLSLRTSVGEVFRTAVSGSSLASIFTTNFNAAFMSGYMDYTDTTTEWTHSEDVVNFLTREVATMGKFGALEKLGRGQTANDLDINDWKESYKIARYAGKFTLDEQDIINDRFGALEQQSPMDMGLSAAQLRPGLVYSEILNNAALDADGGNLFNATAVTTLGGHANYGTTGTALDATPLQAGISAIASQRIKNRPLNLQPRFLIVPQALRWTAEVLLKSQQRIISSASGGTYNPLENLLVPIVDDRLGVSGVVDPRTGNVVAGSATNWLLACRPGDQGAKTIMVGYLAGSGRAPKIRSYVLDRGQWGIGWDIAMDIGVKALDFRAMYFATGAS